MNVSVTLKSSPKLYIEGSAIGIHNVLIWILLLVIKPPDLITSTKPVSGLPGMAVLS